MIGRTTSWRGVLPFALAVAAALTVSTGAQGVVLLPGGSASLPGSTYSAALVQQVDRTFTLSDGTNTYGDITVRERVTRNADNTLNFEYSILNTTPQEVPGIAGVRVYGFGAFSTDVDYDPAGAGTLYPQQADRDSGGNDIGFSAWIAGALPIGQTTKVLTVRTNAKEYTDGGWFSLRACINREMTFGGVAVFRPVPEPATLGLLTLPLPLLLLRRRARQ